MGDAGPPLPALGEDGTEQREVTVLVTGFGPFKTFNHNPSHLITTQLPPILLPTYPGASSTSPSPSFAPIQPTIHLLTHPTPLRVSYPTITTLLPPLLTIHRPDYILHLGMAAGRRHYALETLAHRDGYTIKDIDNLDGVGVGSRRWKDEGCPSVLEVGWDRNDVLERWRQRLKADGVGKVGEIPDVRLSNDAGRFLCDFVLYESLSGRWKEVHHQRQQRPPSSGLEADLDGEQSEPETETEIETTGSNDDSSKEGKVAFLHVPGDTDQAAIDRGARVTVAAIRALVSSWEEGFRRDGRVVVQSSHDTSTMSNRTGSGSGRGSGRGRGRVAVEFVS